MRRLLTPEPLRGALETLLRDGVVVLRGSVPVEVCDRLRARFEALTRDHARAFEGEVDGHGHYPRLVNLQALFPEFAEAFTRNVRAQAVCDAMFGAETVVYTSLYYESGSQQDLHRDTPYFWTEPGWRYLGVWTAFEDADAENGALMVVRGGHRLPEPDRRALRERYLGVQTDPHAPHIWNAYQAEVQAACSRAGLTTEVLSVGKGDTVIWHPNLPHGGAPIRDAARTRHSMVMHVIPVGTPVRGQAEFFDPDLTPPAKEPWGYRTRDGRRYVDWESFSIAHRREVTAADLERAAAERATA